MARQKGTGAPKDTNDGLGEVAKPVDFIRTIINEHMRTGKYEGRVNTRFPLNPTATCISGTPSRSA